MADYADNFIRLAFEYANMSIEFAELKDITLAQWMLESGRGKSRLAVEHNNFGGLKWRSEMTGFAVPVEYTAHDGSDVYCAFKSEREFIVGYWRFLERAPYKGWRGAASSDEKFISFIGEIYAPASPAYAEKVLNLRAEAASLLASMGATDVDAGPGDDSHGTGVSHAKPAIKKFQKSPNRGSRNGAKISRIILHYTTGSLQSAINTFMNPAEAKSSHYIVDRNGDIYQMVEDDQVAWHCKGANFDSIGIEHVAKSGEMLAPAQEAATVALIKWLLSAYDLGPESITGHNFAKGRLTVTACPHSLFGKYVEGNVEANRKTLEDWVGRHFSDFA